MKKSGKQLIAPALMLSFATSGVALAADEPATPAAPPGPSLKDVLTTSGIDIHGYVDAAYSYLSGSGLFKSGVADRVFDTEPNSFNVHQAAPVEMRASSHRRVNRRTISMARRLSCSMPTDR